MFWYEGSKEREYVEIKREKIGKREGKNVSSEICDLRKMSVPTPFPPPLSRSSSFRGEREEIDERKNSYPLHQKFLDPPLNTPLAVCCDHNVNSHI